jgi:hypothetical protein
MFKVKYLVVKVLFLSGILVRSLSMKGFLVELKYSLVIIHKVSKYCPLKLLIVQCSSHVTTLSKYIQIQC